jgi:hypothetical protein
MGNDGGGGKLELDENSGGGGVDGQTNDARCNLPFPSSGPLHFRVDRSGDPPSPEKSKFVRSERSAVTRSRD